MVAHMIPSFSGRNLLLSSIPTLRTSFPTSFDGINQMSDGISGPSFQPVPAPPKFPMDSKKLCSKHSASSHCVLVNYALHVKSMLHRSPFSEVQILQVNLIRKNILS
ncbi:hypothetical protein AMTR_s00012p00095390 [Amborella trichopoda]|uniref:Uncharacterized protein n=1 Tax=Amborella trichopoda TaxID=13333 RepID=W1PKW2_AMBTC|nr:hypothetical protein AMTR_s00012p00095390 [Amborella trichopoda]